MADTSVAITAGVGTPVAIEVRGGLDYQSIVPGARVASLFSELLIDLNPATAGNNDLVALVALQKVKVYGLILNVQGATDIYITDGTTAVVLLPLFSLLAKGAGMQLTPGPIPWFTTAAGSKLTLNSSAAVRITGRLYYIQEP